MIDGLNPIFIKIIPQPARRSLPSGNNIHSRGAGCCWLPQRSLAPNPQRYTYPACADTDAQAAPERCQKFHQRRHIQTIHRYGPAICPIHPGLAAPDRARSNQDEVETNLTCWRRTSEKKGFPIAHSQQLKSNSVEFVLSGRWRSMFIDEQEH